MSDPRERELHLLDYWRVLVKRRWVVYTSLILMVSSVTLGSVLKRPVYTATTRLQIERSTPNVLPFQEVVSSLSNSQNDFYQTQYGLIQSRRVAGEVIASLDLVNHEEFRVAPPERERPGLTTTQIVQAKRIDLLLENLEVAPVRKSRLVDITYSSHDPVLSARVANRVAETYIAFNSAVRYNTTVRATTSLTHQIANLQEKIDARENELQSYAREHGIVALTEDQNMALKNLNDLSDAYTKARANRIAKEARYATLRNAGPENVPEVLHSDLIKELTAKSAELGQRYAQLAEKYKARWPEMGRLEREIEQSQARLAIERQAIYEQVLGVAESAYQTSRNEERQLEKSLEEQKRKTQEIGLKEIRYNNLKAEIANKRSTVEALLKRQAETSSSAALNDLIASNVRIVDVAEVPTRRSSPKILRNMILSLFIGLALGIGLAFFLEYLNKSVNSPDDIHQAAGIPSLGAIPTLRPEGMGLRVIRSNGREDPKGHIVELISHEDPRSKLAEAFRETRTTLLVSQAGGPPRQILITSAQAGEGKTALALNLAITLSQIGRLVLLVDTDLRRPRLHKILGVPNDEGLSSYLSGAEKVWPVPQRTPIPDLDLIPSGPLPPNPADLLYSERFTQVQREFREHGYDHIIYDSPPVLAVADAAIVAGRMDAVVMVVHAGNTSRDALAHAVKKLQQVRARVVGALLNRVDLKQQGYYGGDAYTQYYSHERESGVMPTPLREKRQDRTVQT